MSVRPMSMMAGVRILLYVLCSVGLVVGHGRLAQPPGRASAWRYGFATPADYDDDGANCGGASHQWSGNEGRCGICGDPYDAPEPRAHELGGTYGLGVIVDSYHAGQLIDVTVQLTASHLGFFEISLCIDPNDNRQSCFDEHPLELEQGGYRHPVLESRAYHAKYQLPVGLSCEHCVLQWRYTAGNNWGVCANGTGALGCGPQEQFFGCADITIEEDEYETNSVSDLGSRWGNKGDYRTDYREGYSRENRGDNREDYRGDQSEGYRGDNRGDHSEGYRGDNRVDHSEGYRGDNRVDHSEGYRGDHNEGYRGNRWDKRGNYRGNYKRDYTKTNEEDYRGDNRLGNPWGKWGFSWF